MLQIRFVLNTLSKDLYCCLTNRNMSSKWLKSNILFLMPTRVCYFPIFHLILYFYSNSIYMFSFCFVYYFTLRETNLLRIAWTTIRLHSFTYRHIHIIAKKFLKSVKMKMKTPIHLISVSFEYRNSFENRNKPIHPQHIFHKRMRINDFLHYFAYKQFY